MSSSRELPELGDSIQALTKAISDHLKGAGLPQPSSKSGDGFGSNLYPKAIQDSRAELLDTLDELRTLILGPTSYLYFNAVLSVSPSQCILYRRLISNAYIYTQPSWTATFVVLYRYRIAYHVPDGDGISYADLADKSGLDDSDLRRILRTAISLRIFEEDSEGCVRHNAVSKTLATNPAHDGIGFFMEEYMPAALKLADTLQRFPGSQRAGESAVAMANGSEGDRDIFSLISDDTPRVERLANAMSFMTTVPETSFSNFVANVPWTPGQQHAQICECPKVVVDVGGSRGDLCEALLLAYPQIEKVVVEDLPEVTKSNVERGSPGELSERIHYQPYDFFTEQVVKNADVYLFSNVFHDWSDTYAVQMLRNQIPALKPGARIVINDICIDTTRGQNSVILQAQWYVDHETKDLCLMSR